MASPGFFTRLDAAIYRVERALVVAATGLMTLAVFAAVVWRVWAAPEGKLDGLLRALGAGDAAPKAAEALSALLWVGLAVFAVRTARPAWGVRRRLWVGAAIAAGSLVAAYGLVWLLPEGLVFSQKLALALMMWVMFLGSSMAAHLRRHIFVLAAQRLIPADKTRVHAALSLLVAAGFTAFLTYVGWRYAWSNFTNWLASDLRAGVFDSLPLPYWSVTVCVPLGFGLTMARFVGQAWLIWRGKLAPYPLSPEEEQAAVDAPGVAS